MEVGLFPSLLLRTAISLVVDQLDLALHVLQESLIFDVDGGWCRLLGEQRQVWFPTKEDEVRRHLRLGEWCGVVQPLRVGKMLAPASSVLEETVLEILDEGSVLAFHVPLRLRAIWDARSLLHPKDFAGRLEGLSDELASVVGCQKPRRTKETHEILEASGDSGCCFVAKFVAPDEPREDILEDEDVFVPGTRDVEGDEITHHVIKDAMRDDWLKRRLRLRNLLSELVADAAVLDLLLDIAHQSRPDGVAANLQEHFLHFWVTRPLRAMEAIEDLVDHGCGNDSLQNLCMRCVGVMATVEDAILDH